MTGVICRVSHCEKTRPPTTASPGGRRESEPAPYPGAIGRLAIDAAMFVIMIGRNRTRHPW
jgi:hypothetical protein